MESLKSILEAEILPLVAKPGRYIGGEYGASAKAEAGVRVALAFPDVYEIGMSHLGLRILYSLVNATPDFAAERVFAPWPDMEKRMRELGVPLYGLETFRPLRDFDLVGFSLQHELTYTNVLTMLDLGGIPILARERRGGLPLVVAGGPGAFCPGPLEDFVDLFVVGDGEEALPELMGAVGEWKRAGGGGAGGAHRPPRPRGRWGIRPVALPGTARAGRLAGSDRAHRRRRSAAREAQGGAGAPLLPVAPFVPRPAYRRRARPRGA